MQLSKNHPAYGESMAVSPSSPSGPGVSAINPVVGVPGFEPGTSSLSGTRSNQLSYTPIRNPNFEYRISNFEFLRAAQVVEATGFEPVTFCLQSRCSTS